MQGQIVVNVDILVYEFCLKKKNCDCYLKLA